MMGLILNARQSYSEQRGLLDNVVAKNKATKQRIVLANKQSSELETAKGRAAVAKLEAVSRRDGATAIADRNPQTSAAAKRQAAELFDEVEALFAQQVAAARDADDAEAEAAALEAELVALEEMVKAEEADINGLRRETQRMKDVLVDVVARRGGSNGSGAAAARTPQQTANDVWGHIQRAQAQRQPQLAGFMPVPIPGQYPAPYPPQQSPININIGGAQAGGGMPAMPPGAYFVPGASGPPTAPPGFAAVPVYGQQTPLGH